MIIVFAFFGTRLPVEKMVVLGNPGWKLAVVITIFMLFAKIDYHINNEEIIFFSSV